MAAALIRQAAAGSAEVHRGGSRTATEISVAGERAGDRREQCAANSGRAGHAAWGSRHSSVGGLCGFGSDRISLWAIGATAKPAEPRRKSPPANGAVHARFGGPSLRAPSARVLPTAGRPRQAQDASTAGGDSQTTTRYLWNVPQRPHVSGALGIPTAILRPRHTCGKKLVASEQRISTKIGAGLVELLGGSAEEAADDSGGGPVVV